MKISIIIPTRERARYLGASIATATAIADPDIEIVVSDNASTDGTEALVAGIDDPRLRYLNTGKRLSMRQNFEFALNASEGDYVVFFGDDDGILPGQFPALRRILEAECPDALAWDFPVYGWPAPDQGGKTGGFRLKAQSCFGAPTPLDRATQLRRVRVGDMARMYPLPALYHGAMSRSYLDDLRTADGIYFAACSPDVYINYRALARGGTLLHVAHPFSINGYSPASTGGSMRDVGQNSKSKDVSYRFISETGADPVRDVLPLTSSSALGFLSMLETVNARFPHEAVRPDYEGWFRAALSDKARKDAATAASIDASLELYADRLDARPALAAARAAGPEGKGSRLSRTAAKLRDKIGSVRLSAARDRENTIATAARVCDAVLGDGMLAVLDGRQTRSAAWSAARRRSRDFDRQL